MKTREKYISGIAGITAVLLFTLAACADFIKPEENPSGAGKGLARINLSLGLNPSNSARTVLPDISGLYFELEFTADAKPPVTETRDGGSSITVVLEPAEWTLEVKGYADSPDPSVPENFDPDSFLVMGTAQGIITDGSTTNFDVYMAQIKAGTGTGGSLSYDISFPPTVSRAFLALSPIDSTQGESYEEDITINSSSTIPDLSAGSYRAVIDLYDGTYNKALVMSTAVHIYAGLPTSLNEAFTIADFAECSPEVGGNETTLSDKLDVALAFAGPSCTVKITGYETDLAAFSPKPLTVTGKNLEIILQGNGHTVELGSNGSMFTLGANNGSLTLVLWDVKLKGKALNTGGNIVEITDGGTLEMRAGSFITGIPTNHRPTMKQNSDNVVKIHPGGNFILSGGSVSGNSGMYGIYIAGGTFTMSGGEVRDNSGFWMGGIYVQTGGLFTMSGGTVSGNSGFYAGGVAVLPGGTFTMSGGAVYGNFGDYIEQVYIDNANFKINGTAWVERVLLTSTAEIIIEGDLNPSNAQITIDLFEGSLYTDKPLLGLDYPGNLAILKNRFTLGNSVTSGTAILDPVTHEIIGMNTVETPLTGYTIRDDGKLVAP